MRFAKPHIHLTWLIYFPLFFLSAYLVLFKSYWVLKSISVICFVWLLCLTLMALSPLGNKIIGESREQTILTEQKNVFFQTLRFQGCIFIALIGGLFAIHSFISPKIIIFPKTYAFITFFSWVIYLLFTAAFACFANKDAKLSYINQCLSPLLNINYLKKHEDTFKVVNNTYFFQANFMWFTATFAILLFAITRLCASLLHTHLNADFTFGNCIIASILFLILSSKPWLHFLRHHAHKKQFFILFLTIVIFLIGFTNLLSWLFYYIDSLFGFVQITDSFSIQRWFNWIDSTVLNQVFIWSWLLGFAPLVAFKTVEIYRGFTIKKMIGYSLILPIIVSATLWFLSSFTMIATNLPGQLFTLMMFILSLGLIIFGFLTEQSFQKLFFSRITIKDDDKLHNVMQATRGIFQNIVALFILLFLFGLFMIAIIVPIMFFPIWLLTILLCITLIYAIRQSQRAT